MKIGIYFTPTKHHGGVYQYSLAILESLQTISGHTYVIFTSSPDVPKKYYKSKRFTVIELNNTSRNIYEKVRIVISNIIATFASKLISFLYQYKLFWLVSIPDRFSNQSSIKLIRDAGVDFMIYPTSSNLSFLTGIPSAVAIHDLAHRLYPEFPEVSAGGRWELREYSFQQMTSKADYILVDSEIGKEDVLNCYPYTNPDKVVILPFLPPSYLKLNLTTQQIAKAIKPFKLPSKYFYYPAKFWPHKHHLDLLEAIKICHERGYKYGLALTGTPAAEFDTSKDVKEKIHEYGLESYVKMLGHVSELELSALYRGAVALTMPTNFGPTNIPVSEAWKLKTPVIYSNVRGCKEQLGNAGISADPGDPQVWSKAMIKIATNQKFAKACVINGTKRLNLWTNKDFQQQISQIISGLNLKK